MGWYVGYIFSEERSVSIFMALQWERYTNTDVLGDIFFKNTEDKAETSPETMVSVSQPTRRNIP